MTKTKTHRMVQTALIGALYTALTLAMAPFSFGTVQFRISEALVLLPLFSPAGIWGVTFGCFFSNILGFLLGTNPLGIVDAFVGTTATLIGAVLTRLIGRWFSGEEKRSRIIGMLLAPVPPVIMNALLVGMELAVVFGGKPGESFGAIFVFQAASVALGEVIVLYTFGMLLCGVLRRNDLYKKLFR
ncbi:MAG: QueT transporter family protein [Oscillospiraceae bacterium]|nr:QueT transporter family protein [Oscillospiraceae bacterium]